MRIAVDIMGSDSSPDILFEGVLQAAEKLENSDSIVVLATKAYANSFQKNKKVSKKSIEFLVVPEFIEMADSPLYAVRRKKKSSIVHGMQLINNKEADAFVSAGNTGALVTAAKLLVRPLKGFRPALLTFFPTEKQPMVVIDVGGTLSPLSEHLVQHALMGISFQRSYLGIKKPTVGLLNIGSESKKGTEELLKTYEILEKLSVEQKNCPFSFVGNIEGKEAFLGKVDILVTDGFTGNVFLKTAEGMSSFIFDELRKMDCCNEKIISQLQQKFGYDQYPGALICGIDGIVIKCHGYSTAMAMSSAIQGALNLAKKKIIQKIKQYYCFKK